MKKTTKTNKQFLALSIDPTSIDKEKKQFKVVVATETPVFRRNWEENFYEILVCNKENMRTQRMDNGVCPLMDNHDVWTGVTKQYGSLIAYEVSDGEVRATIQFSLDPSREGIWKDIEGGIIRGISARYIPWVYQREIVADRTEPNYRAIDWEITEVSLAPVPADFNSMVRSDDNDKNTFEVTIDNFSKQNTNTKMETTKEGAQPATQERSEGGNAANPTIVNAPVNEGQIRAEAATAERKRIADIRTAVRTANLEESVATELIESGSTIDAARATIFEKMAAKQPATPKVTSNAANAHVTSDEGDAIRAAMQSVIIYRAEGGVKLEGKAVEMRGMKLFDMARHMLELKGEKPYGFNQNETVARAIATTDFPDLLTSTVNRQLRKYFEAQLSPWKSLGAKTSVSDFRKKTGIQVDGAVTFDKIAENGEYKAASIIQNDKATIGVDTYGKLFKISRKAIINDDLDVFSRIPKLFAIGAENMQSKMFWDMITTPAKTPDGKNLFHADHGNLAGAGAVIDETSLNAALVAMMLQKSPAGEELNLKPKYLIVPIELQTKAKKMLASITPNQTSSVNPFENSFEIISEVRLSRASAISWYLAADPASSEGLMYCYLDGEEGLYTESRTNFDDDSIETKARIEFGVAAWEHRGWYKNPGA